MRDWFGLRLFVGVTGAIAAIVVALLAASSVGASAPSGAVFTSTNPAADNPGGTTTLCLNGGPNVNTVPAVNCNIYADKNFVWLTGGPGPSALADGTYFFAVLDPGGQPDPNDGSAKNLSSPNDTYLNRTFSTAAGVITYAGNTPTETAHDYSNNEIRLMPYNDTTNPGGVYIMAVCSLAGGSPVVASDCKYDAFKVHAAAPCTSGCGPGVAADLTVSKDAAGAYTTTWTWNISKTVDNTVVKQSGATATFFYTVTVTHDAGANAGITVTGTIDVTNPNTDPVSISGVTDQLSDGTVCTVTSGGAQVLPGASSTPFTYACSLTTLPASPVFNTAAVTWPTQFLVPSGDALVGNSGSFMFPSDPSGISFAQTKVDDSVTVTDPLGGGLLGTVFSTDPSPTTFTYSHVVTGTPGTCVSQDNTATFMTDTTSTTGSDSKTVKLCVGSDLSVSKTATPSFTRTYNWNITKAVDKTLVEQIGGGTAMFNYTVKVKETGFTDSNWQVNGMITVANPNDWEAITANITDATNNGGSCTVTGGTGLSLPARGSVNLPYSCTYASAPSPSSGINTATGSWNADTFFTPDGSASGTAPADFTGLPTATVNKTITVTDNFNSVTTTLGTLMATDSPTFAAATYTYSRTVNVPTFNCLKFTNTAVIVETTQSASQTIEVCGPAKTGALTMGFWQNKNGQGIIQTNSGANCQNLRTWLNQFHPFSDLTATVCGSSPSLGATSGTGVAGSIYNVIKAAQCTSAANTCNSMLKAQMLATALDVYFSDPALGGNKIGAPAPIGGVTIDLTKICQMIDGSGGTATCSGAFESVSSAFGGASSLTVLGILSYAASQSNVGGTTWYGNVKATQVLAKDAFDAINNQVAFSP